MALTNTALTITTTDARVVSLLCHWCKIHAKPSPDNGVVGDSRDTAGPSYNLFCFLQSVFGFMLSTGDTHTRRDKGMHHGLGSLMFGLALIAHEQRQNSLEKNTYRHRSSHTSVYIKGTLTNTCLLQYQTLCILLQLLRADSALGQTQFWRRKQTDYTHPHKQITCLCGCVWWLKADFVLWWLHASATNVYYWMQ